MSGKLSVKELAAKLDGRKYLHEMNDEERQQAIESGLVVLYGRSDDLAVFDGAICDETGACECGLISAIYLTHNKVFVNECSNPRCPYCEREMAKCSRIIVRMSADGFWFYTTDIPHATFRIFEDGVLYCIGIVFHKDSLEKVADNNA